MGFMENSKSKSRSYYPQQLYILNEEEFAITVNISTRFNNGFQQFNVAAKGTQEVDIIHTTRFEKNEIARKGVRVESTGIITLYGVNRDHFSLDAFLLLPITALANDYVAITYYPSGYKGSEVLILAAYNSTDVEILIPLNRSINIALSGAMYTDGDEIKVTLNEDEGIQLQDLADLTGLKIAASKVVLVLAGNQKTKVTAVGISSAPSADHLSELMTPIVDWDTLYIIPATPARPVGDQIKVVSYLPDTNISIPDFGLYYHLDAYESAQFYLPAGTVVALQSTYPVMVARFTLSRDSNKGLGDPAMAIIPSARQFVSYVPLVTPKGISKNYKHYLQVRFLTFSQKSDVFTTVDEFC